MLENSTGYDRGPAYFRLGTWLAVMFVSPGLFMIAVEDHELAQLCPCLSPTVTQDLECTLTPYIFHD